jgi:hypothetical protein
MTRSITLVGFMCVALMALASMAGCAVLPAGGTAINIHTWRQLTWSPTAAWQGPTSGMYTYALVGDVGLGDGDPESQRARAALAKLLALVQKSEQGSSQSIPSMMAAHVNQFAIPTKADVASDTRIGLDQYDFKLGASYRQWFQVITAKDPALGNALSGPGPYLVATRVPIAQLIAENNGQRAVVADSPILVMDMSGYSDVAVPYFVDSFKAAVAIAQPASAKLTPMKPLIVEFLKTANQALPILAEFWSKTRKNFEPT